MKQYFLYLTIGLIEGWIIAMMGAMATRISQPWPYCAMAGSLLLLVVAAPVSVFYEEIAAVIGFIAGVLFLIWVTYAGLSSGRNSWIYLLLGALPLIILADAFFRVRAMNGNSWLILRPTPHLYWKILLALIPIVLFSKGISVFFRLIFGRE